MFNRLCLAFSLFLFFNLSASLSRADDEAAKYSAFLDALERIENDRFTEIEIQELRKFLQRYPQAANRDEMTLRIASIFDKKAKKVPAFLTYLEIVYFCPNSTHLQSAKDGLRVLIMNEGKFESLRARIDEVLGPNLPDTTAETAAHTLLRDVRAYELRDVNKLLIDSCDEFARRFPGSPQNDEVLFWKAELLSEDRQEEHALADFMKLTFLYDKSLYATASKLKMADLYAEKLNMHQNAIVTLDEFLLKFPDDPQAPYAQLRLGQIQENKKKSYQDAITAYTAVAQKYPKSLEAVPALFDAARLYEEKFKDYDQAIRIYTDVIKDFPNDLKAPYAMVEAARIYENKLKDYFNAANVYFKVYGSYPESSIAVQSLYAAAEINEKKIADYERALTYYRLIVDTYPNDKLAAQASKRIEKISRELGN